MYRIEHETKETPPPHPDSFLITNALGEDVRLTPCGDGLAKCWRWMWWTDGLGHWFAGPRPTAPGIKVDDFQPPRQ